MHLDEKIKQVGSLFTDRLDPEIVADATEYVDFSECKLAVEMLCDQLFEYDVPITSNEFQQIEELAAETGADLERVEVLRPLVQSTLS